MARCRRIDIEEETDLDLAPIMNMVVILIPLLLLSVVFLSVSVIPVHRHKMGSGRVTDNVLTGPPPLNLQLFISPHGFALKQNPEHGAVPSDPGCKESSVTICLISNVEVQGLVAQSRESFERGDKDQGQRQLDQALDAYNWHQLYNRLSEIKARHPQELTINITAADSLPNALVTRVLDVSRQRLEKSHYGSAQAYWRAQEHAQKPQLFPHPVLAALH